MFLWRCMSLLRRGIGRNNLHSIELADLLKTSQSRPPSRDDHLNWIDGYSLGQLVMTKICFFVVLSVGRPAGSIHFDMQNYIFGGFFFPRSWEQCTKWRATNHLRWINITRYLLTKKHGILQDQERYVLVSNQRERTSRGHCHRLWIYYTMYIYIYIYMSYIFQDQHTGMIIVWLVCTNKVYLFKSFFRYSLIQVLSRQIFFWICFVNTYLIYDTMQRPSSWWYMVLDFILKDMVWYKKP